MNGIVFAACQWTVLFTACQWMVLFTACQWTVLFTACQWMVLFTACQWTVLNLLRASERCCVYCVPVNGVVFAACQWTVLCLLRASERCCVYCVPVNGVVFTACQWTVLPTQLLQNLFFRSFHSPFNSSFISFYFYSFCSDRDEMTNRPGRRDKTLSSENSGQIGTYGKRNNNNNNCGINRYKLTELSPTTNQTL